MSGVCGRPLRKGGTCKVGTSAADVVDFGRFPDYIIWKSPACGTHMTAEEAAARRAITEPIEEASARAWREAVPACWQWDPARPPEPAWMADYRQRHGLDLEFDGEMVLSEWQQGRCAMCGRTPPSLVTDHDHDTALIRGLLCRSCNTREGFNRGSSGPFAKYREKNPASILDVRERYVDMYGNEAQPTPPRSSNPWDDVIDLGL